MNLDGVAAGGLRSRISDVQSRIAASCTSAGRSPDSVCLVAVTKMVTADMVRTVMSAGLEVFAENRTHEADAKIAKVGGGTWHLIGHLQRNKARIAAQRFACIQSVDSPRLARRLEAVREQRKLDVLVQVNIMGARQQDGVAPPELAALCNVIDRETSLTLRGLMTIGPSRATATALRECFSTLHEMRNSLRSQVPNQPLDQLSMGMTDDFELAIAEGSTLVRVGRAIFGERPPAVTNIPAPD